MGKIVDKAGREWSIVLDYPLIARIKKELEINLLEIVREGSELASQLCNTMDPTLAVDVLYVLVRDQAEERKVSDLEFGRTLTPDALVEAIDMITEDAINFFPKSARAIYRKVFEAAKRVRAAAEGKINTALADKSLDKTIDQAVENYTTKIESENGPTGVSTEYSNSPESLESTPGGTRSEA